MEAVTHGRAAPTAAAGNRARNTVQAALEGLARAALAPLWRGSGAGWLTGALFVHGAAWPATIAWQAPVEIARGAGERGPWRQNESRYDFVDDPTAAYNARGELAVAWVDQRRKAVMLQRYAADGSARLPAPVDVSRHAQTFSWLPRLAWAPDDPDRLLALWQEIVFSGGSHGGEILGAVSADGGRSFAAAVNLSQSTPGDGKGRLDRDTWHNGSLDIAAGRGGQVFAAWTEYDGRLWLARSDDGGRRYAKPLLVAGEPPAKPARAPAIAIGADGAVVLAWTTGEDAGADIWVARSRDGGRSFDTATRAAATAGHSDAPKLAFDARGMLHRCMAKAAARRARRRRSATCALPTAAVASARRPRTRTRCPRVPAASPSLRWASMAAAAWS
jgi:hypothetical protein